MPGATPSAGFYYVAVSKNSDPRTSGSQDWYFYEIDVTEFDPGNNSNRWSADYPGIGVDAQALYIAFNMNVLTGSGPHYLNSQILVLKKADINSGTLTVSRIFTPGGDVTEVGSGFGQRGACLQPATGHDPGATNPGNVAYFAETPVLIQHCAHLGAQRPVAQHQLNFRSRERAGQRRASASAPQPGTNIRLETWSHHTRDMPSGTAGRFGFARLLATSTPDRTWSITQSQRQQLASPAAVRPWLTRVLINGGPGEWTFQPAIHANNVGDVCIVFTQSSSTRFHYHVYRASACSSFETPSVLKISPNAYIGVTRSTNNARWGDWAIVSADPTDGSFWVSHEWAKSTATDNWSTWWGQVRLSSTISTNNNFADAKAISGINGSATGYNFYANKETGEPNHAGNTGGKSVWWL
jgi:hypothetical protein